MEKRQKSGKSEDNRQKSGKFGKNRQKSQNAMGKWLYLNTVIIVAIALAASLFVQLSASLNGNGDFGEGVLRSLGIIVPMCVLITGYNAFMFRSGYRHVNLLCRGIAEIAGGDFSVRLDTDRAKSLKPVYENINAMAEELQKSAFLKNDFINNFSHEFKTPISSINGFAELLLKTEVGEEERRQYLQIIYDESARLARLSASTMLLSKLDNLTIMQGKKKYALDEQLRRTAIMCENDCREKGVALSVQLEPTEYCGNAEIMQQLWLNLLSNAVKFTPNGGKIELSLEKCLAGATVTVRDSGKGMTAEQCARVFSKYYQAEKDGGSGLGLGLSIARRIVELCGGRIEVESVIGEGSRFTVRL